MADGGAFVAGGGGRAELNQDDDGGGYGNRGNGVENDAEGTVIGVRFQGVGVGHLEDCQQRKQDEAQSRRQHQITGLGEDGLASS